MYTKFKDHLTQELQAIEDQGLFKKERIITSAQDAVIKISTGQEVINFCANNYLGLSSHPAVVQAAKDTLDSHGFGMSSVRFICGTQDIHKQLEAEIASFYQTEDTILYAAAFDANGGVFVSKAFLRVESFEVKLHLAFMLGLERTHFEFNCHQGA